MVLLSLSGRQPTDIQYLADGETAPKNASVAVPFARFAEESESFFDKANRVGAVISTDTHYRDLAPLVNRLAFVVIDFPTFVDGRGFSLAVRLRKDLGFKGEIRATGHVIPDQAMHLMRSGFDIVDVTEARKEAFEKFRDRYKDFYQVDFGGTRSIAQVRHKTVTEGASS